MEMNDRWWLFSDEDKTDCAAEEEDDMFSEPWAVYEPEDYDND